MTMLNRITVIDCPLPHDRLFLLLAVIFLVPSVSNLDSPRRYFITAKHLSSQIRYSRVSSASLFIQKLISGGE